MVKSTFLVVFVFIVFALYALPSGAVGEKLDANGLCYRAGYTDGAPAIAAEIKVRNVDCSHVLKAQTEDFKLPVRMRNPQ